jgi:lysophospholipase L1-like esterase
MAQVNATITGQSTGLSTAKTLTALAVADAIATEKEAAVIIIMGQSNAQGAAPNADINPALDRTYTDVTIFNGSAFVPLQLTTNQASSGKHGFEMALADALEAAGKKAYIIKAAYGGSSLDFNNGSNDWLPYKGVNTKNAIQNYLIPALGLIDAPLAVNVIWCQGEADSNGANAGFAQRYERNLLALFHQLSSCVHINRAVVIQTNANIAPGTYTAVSTVRSAQAAAVSQMQNATLLNFDSEALQGDGVHYTADAYATIGAALLPALRFYESPILKADRFYKEMGIIDFRQEGAGASSLVTGVTTSSVDVVASTSLGLGLQLTGRATNGGANIALAEVNDFKSTGVEMDIELVTGGAIGGPLFAGYDNGSGVKVGWLVRLVSGDIKLFRKENSTTTLMQTNTRTIPIGTNIGLRMWHDGQNINVLLKEPGKRWVNVLSYSDPNYVGKNLYLTAGWGGSDETKVLFGNIRTFTPE